jgi:predicted RNase H-like HicB family nuclease
MEEMAMRPKQLFVRCYAKRDGNIWVAFCVDFSLGAQADTLEEAKRKLEDQIREYVHDALAGDDRQNAGYLLNRSAPLSFWLEYWAIRVAFKLARLVNARRPVQSKPFNEVLPMVPAVC